MHRWDHYIPIYERHFGRFRDRPIKMLEIGIQYGGGLYMWHRYFHPGSSIHGVDINERQMQSIGYMRIPSELTEPG